MRRETLTAAILSVPVLLGGTAAYACPIAQSGLPERTAELAGERGVLTPEAAAALARMRTTAEELDRLGFGPQCEEVLDTALALVEGEAAWQPPAPGDTIAATVGTLNLATLSSTGTRASALVGRTVLTTGGATVGVVEDIMFEPAGSASHALVRRGSWEDETERLAIPAPRLLGEPSGRLYVEIAPEALASAPGWSEGSDLAENDRWYTEQAGSIVEFRSMEARKARTLERARAEIGMSGEEEKVAAEPPRPAPAKTAETVTKGGPKRIRVERDRPESAEGSSD